MNKRNSSGEGGLEVLFGTKNRNKSDQRKKTVFFISSFYYLTTYFYVCKMGYLSPDAHYCACEYVIG